MYYDLVPIKGKYRGMGRSLLGTDLLNSETQKQFKYLLELYFEFIDYSQNINKQSFERTIKFCKILESYNVICELIVYDEEVLEEAFGYSIEFLGIDVVHDMCESLIEGGLCSGSEMIVNQNGLCKTMEDVEIMINNQDHGGVEWKGCYVYKVII